MPPSTTITVRLPQEIEDKLGRLASSTRRTKSFLAGEAIADYVRRELDIIEGINRGLEDVRAGRVVPHEQAMAELDAAIAATPQRKTARRR
jgi:predicted transcriptional regulator